MTRIGGAAVLVIAVCMLMPLIFTLLCFGISCAAVRGVAWVDGWFVAKPSALFYCIALRGGTHPTMYWTGSMAEGTPVVTDNIQAAYKDSTRKDAQARLAEILRVIGPSVFSWEVTEHRWAR